MKPETRFTAVVKQRLNIIPNSWWVKIQLVALRGIPDFLGCMRGKFVALELKVGNNKPTMLQAFVIKKIQEAGGYAKVVTPENLEEVLKELECL